MTVPHDTQNNQDDVMNIIRMVLKTQMETKALVVKIERRQRWARNINIFYVIILIGGVLGVYSFAKPYLSHAISVFEILQSSFSPLRSAGEPLKK